VTSGSEYSVTVAGPGAIGSLVAARLALAGVRVLLLDHLPARASTLSRSGITVEDGELVRTAHPAVTADPAAAARADCIIVCVKAYSTEALCRQLAPHVQASSTILSLQNGLGNVELLMRLKSRVVLAGVTGLGALLSAAGRVRCAGDGVTWIAAARGADADADPVTAVLRTAGFDVRRHLDLRAMLWTKLILNAAVNPLTARYRLCNGDLPSHPQAGPLARQIIAEAVAVAIAAGIPINEREMLDTFQDLCRRTAENHSSMLRDTEQGRPTEMSAITGAIVGQADGLGIPVPVNRWILAHPVNDGIDVQKPLL